MVAPVKSIATRLAISVNAQDSMWVNCKASLKSTVCTVSHFRKAELEMVTTVESILMRVLVPQHCAERVVKVHVVEDVYV